MGYKVKLELLDDVTREKYMQAVKDMTNSLYKQGFIEGEVEEILVMASNVGTLLAPPPAENLGYPLREKKYKPRPVLRTLWTIFVSVVTTLVVVMIVK